MSQVTFLVVDDATFVRDLIKRNIRDHFPGSKVIEAPGVRKALSIMKQQPIDIILSDWEMPEVTGEEFLKMVRANPDTEKMPFVMISSRADRDYIVKAIEAGVSDYLGKPFSPDEFVKKVSKALRRVGKLPKPKQQVASSNPFGGGSLDVLTAASSRAPEKPAVDNGASNGGQKNNRPQLKRWLAQAQLRSLEQTHRSVIEDLTLKQILLVIKRVDPLPQLFQQVVVDIQPDGSEEMVQLNGFTSELQAVDPNLECDWVRVTIRFIDDDIEKKNLISQIISATG